MFGKEKKGFTVHGPRLLLHLQRRVDRSSLGLLLLQTMLQHSKQ